MKCKLKLKIIIMKRFLPMIYFLINGYEVMLFASIEPRLFSSEEKLANPTFQNDTIFFYFWSCDEKNSHSNCRHRKFSFLSTNFLKKNIYPVFFL